MKREYEISIYLDKRRAKKGGVYPVKLKVYLPSTVERKYYPTKFEMTEDAFRCMWEKARPKDEYKDMKRILQSIELKANEVAQSITPFNLEKFERKLTLSKEAGNNISFHYNSIIQNLKANNQFGTASNYELSLKSLIDYITDQKSRKVNSIAFSEITPDWLKGYENYMLNFKERSRTTVSMYLRALRSVYNSALGSDLSKATYPFYLKKENPKGYKIPTGRAVKKFLSGEQIKKLFTVTPGTMEQEKARDFWFFSYVCNGMNIKDIALLKYQNLKNDRINFYRAKTMHTLSENSNPIVVILHDFAKNVISKYGNADKRNGNFIFPILDQNDSALTAHVKIKNFTKFINQNLKKLAVAHGLPAEISTYWARHSFATISIQNGASMEYVGEALGHSDFKTTQNYFGGFNDKYRTEQVLKLL